MIGTPAKGVLDHIGGTEVDVGGRLAIEFKRVDYHNDGSRFGGFASIQGAVDAAFPDIAISSPPLPIAGGIADITLEGGFAGSTVTLAADTAYDASKENPGAVSGSLAGSTAAQIGATASMGVRFIGNVSVEIVGNADLTACGSIALNGGEIVAAGSVGVGNFAVTASGDATIAGKDLPEFFSASHIFDYSVESDFEIILHDFGGAGQ